MAVLLSQNDDNRICATCGDLLLFACREDAEPGFEISTFQCGRYLSVEQLRAAVSPRIIVDEKVA
jgi:hypothetical protein